MNGKSFRWVHFMVYPWLITLGLRVLGPINYRQISNDLVIFIIFFVISGVLGYKLGLIRVGWRNAGTKLAVKNSSSMEMLIIILLSLTYLILVAVDFFVVKGGTLSTITAIREEDNLTGSRMSVLGGIVAFTSAAPYVLLCKIHHSRAINDGGKARIIYILALAGAAASFLSGGRNGFLIGITIFFVQVILLKQETSKNSEKKRGVGLNMVFIVAASIFSMYLFIEREVSQGTDINQLLSIFASKWDIEISEIKSESFFLGAIYAALTMFIFYITHALSYVDQYMISNISPLLLGGYNFPIPAKIIDFVVGSEISSNISDKLLLSGVYLTLPGSLYVDFGYVGAIFIGLLIGLITGVSRKLSAQHTFLGVHFASFMITLWLLSPLYSMPAMANGFSFILIMYFLYLTDKLGIMLRKK